MSNLIRRCSCARLLPLLPLVLLATCAQAAFVHPLEFRQMSFIPLDGSEPTLQSAVGEVIVVMDAGPETEYLNVRAFVPGLSTEPVWIVRNLLLHDDTVGMPIEEYGVRFPLDGLGVESGMPLAEIWYGSEVTPQPLLDADYEAWAVTVPAD